MNAITKINLSQLGNNSSANITLQVARESDTKFRVNAGYSENGSGVNGNINKNTTYEGTPAEVEANIANDYPEFADNVTS